MTRAVQISVIALVILVGYILWLRFIDFNRTDRIKELEQIKKAIVTKDSLDAARYHQVIDSLEVLKSHVMEREIKIDTYLKELSRKNEAARKDYNRNRPDFVNRPDF